MGMRALSLVAFLCSGCFSTSSYQTAHMLPQGATRLSVAVNNYEAHGSDSSNGNTSSRSNGADAFEIMGSQGVAEKIEIGGKISWIDAPANIFHFLVVPKISLIPDRLALVVPTGGSYVGKADLDGDGMNESKGSHFFETLPGLAGSYVINKYFELTGAYQVLWLVNDKFDDSEFYTGMNIGVRLTPPGQRWALQPEFGVMIPITSRDSNSIDYLLQYGVAFHYELGGTVADPAAGTAPVAPP